MSVESVKRYLRDFASSTSPAVVVLSGDWGVGKTFIWKQVLEEASRQGAICGKHYAYVSLFGVNSLEDFQFAVFRQMVPVRSAGTEPSLESFRENAFGVTFGHSRRIGGHLLKLPFVQDFAPFLRELSALGVTDSLVCVDDLERRGAGLTIGDVLGHVSHLREASNCKVLLILNENGLALDEQANYRRYLEKVVDAELKFVPTVDECAAIGLTGGRPGLDRLKRCAAILGVRNIRTLSRIRAQAERLLDVLGGMDEELVDEALSSLFLFAWCRFGGEAGAPSLEFVKAIRSPLTPWEPESATPNIEMDWRAILRRYGYSETSDLDLAIAKFVEEGVFDEALVREAAVARFTQLSAGRSENSFRAAWRLFHDSFDENETELVSALETSVRANAAQISPSGLDATVRLLRELRGGQVADSLVEAYIDARRPEVEIFDLENAPFGKDVRDDYVRKRFAEIHAEDRPLPSLAEVVTRLAKLNGWSHVDLEVLRAASVDDIYALLKTERGKSLGAKVDGLLQFWRLSAPTEEMRAIGQKAVDALRRIGTESALNRRRVLKFEVPLSDAGGDSDVPGRVSVLGREAVSRSEKLSDGALDRSRTKSQ